MNFHSVNVDIAAVQHHASQIEWLNPASYFNGFHPVLLPILIKVSGITHWPLTGLLLSNLLYGLSCIWVYRIVHSQVNDVLVAVLATLIICSLKPFFEVFVSPMQDSLLVFLVLISLHKLIQKDLLWSGVFIGLAALARGHALYIGLLIFVFYVLKGKSLKQLYKWPLGAFIAYTPQMVVNIAATGNPFANHQLFNIYQHFYLGTFDYTAQLEVPSTLVQLIGNNPHLFFKEYVNLISQNLLFIAIPIIGIAWGVYVKRRPTITISLICLLYFATSILSNSSRAFAPALIFLALLTAYFIRYFKTLDFPGKYVLALTVIGLVHYSFIQNLTMLLDYRQSEKLTSEFSELMIHETPNLERKQVFNGHFEFTYTGIPGTIGRVRTNNWYRYKNEAYNTHYPAPLLTLPGPEMLDYCQTNEIQFLVIREGLIDEQLLREWQNTPGLKSISSRSRLRYSISTYYEILSKETDRIHLIKVGDAAI